MDAHSPSPSPSPSLSHSARAEPATSTPASPSPYLIGSYAPIDTEIDAECTEVIGEVPRDLFGAYVRNGPNPRFAPPGRYHWFDGDGMLHAVHIEDGRVFYRNRWIKTEALARETAEGAALWSGVMEPVAKNPKSAWPYKDTANTDVLFHNGSLLATWYMCGAPYDIDPRSLETRGAASFGGKRSFNVSAHAKVDPRTGELLFFNYGVRPPFMTYGVVGADGALKHHIPIELPGPRLPHDMAITERYSILMDLPIHLDERALRAGRWQTQYRRDVPARFGVIPRFGAPSDVRWFEAESCYIYHSINAWEEGDEIVMVGCRVDDALPAPNPEDGAYASMMAILRVKAKLHRWRFDLATGETREETLDDRNTEFPSMSRARLGRPTRYSYNVSMDSKRTLLFDGVVKYDTDTGASESHAFGPGRFGSESPFAPRAGASASSAEDDGYVLSFVHDEAAGKSELVILDARALSNGPVARVVLPQRVPLGFHACWVPGEKLSFAGA
jgi:carotenoid cleavage dioxygenase-like enzyme